MSQTLLGFARAYLRDRGGYFRSVANRQEDPEVALHFNDTAREFTMLANHAGKPGFWRLVNEHGMFREIAVRFYDF